MSYNPDDVSTWPGFKPLIIAHDVGRSRDRSTAVVGGNSPFGRRLLGIGEAEEVPQNLFGTARASALATVDRRYNNNALIVADLSNDATYAEVLHETFGPRVIGTQISRHGDGMTTDWRPTKHGALPVYTIGRSHLLELFHTQLQCDVVRFAKTPMICRAFEQLANLSRRRNRLQLSAGKTRRPRHLLRDAGLDGAASAFGILAQKSRGRTSAAPAAKNVQLGSVYIGIEFRCTRTPENISGGNSAAQ